MKGRTKLVVALTGLVGWANYATSQVPGIPAFPGAGLPGIAPGPLAPTPPKTLWGFLGLGKEQKEFCLRKLCKTPLGKLLNNSTLPLQSLSGGLIPPFCPTTPSISDLMDPGAVGAASKIMLDEAQAKARRAAVRYLGTVDCHYWPEAEEGLIGALRGDRNECVRYEAALALGSGCCCTKKTIEALTIVVSCSDRDGAPKESSERVHAAARMALDHCMACFRAPAPPPKPEKPKPEGEGEGEKDKEKDKTNPMTPPVPPANAPDQGEVKPAGGLVLGEAKPYMVLGEAKPVFHEGVMQASAKVAKPGTRPVGFEYYALIAQTPMAPIIAEARRVAAAVPLPSTPPSERSLVAIIEHAKKIPASEKAETGERIAEVVSERPGNLWDMMAGKPAVPDAAKPTIAVAVKATQAPALAKASDGEKSATKLTDLQVVEPAFAVKPAKTPAAVSKPAAAPSAVEAPVRGGLLSRSLPSFKSTIEPVVAPMPAAAPVVVPAATPKAVELPMPMPTEAPVRPSVSARPLQGFRTAVQEQELPKASLSPFNATTIENPLPKPTFTPAARPSACLSKPAPLCNACDEKKPMVTVTLDDRPTTAPAPVMSVAKATRITCDKAPLPVPTAPTMQRAALPTLPIAPPKPVVVEEPPMIVATRKAEIVLAQFETTGASETRLQAVSELTSADLSSSNDLVEKLMSVARRSQDDTERKAAIQALVRGKAARPEVFATLGLLSKDPSPVVRAEAVIGLARLRLAAAQ